MASERLFCATIADVVCVVSCRVVEFATYQDMRNAIDKLDDTDLNGRRIRLVEDTRRRRRSRSSSSRSRSRSRSRGRRTRSRSRWGISSLAVELTRHDGASDRVSFSL